MAADNNKKLYIGENDVGIKLKRCACVTCAPPKTSCTVMEVDKAIEEVSKHIGIRLKEKQLEAIKHFCSGKDVFVSLPTGYGKSLIYEQYH